jgi:NitT/TauT family transport system substrate-binding protein
MGYAKKLSLFKSTMLLVDYFMSFYKILGLIQKHRAVLLLVSLLLNQSVCASQNKTGDTSTSDYAIKVNFDLWPGYYPLVLADELGLYERYGTQIDFVVPENTDQMLNDFTAGKVDVICAALGDILALSEKDPDIRIVLVSDHSHGGDSLIRLREHKNTDSQTTVASTRTNGKRPLTIGTNLGGFGEVFVRQYIEQLAGTEPTSIVQLEASQALNALEKGRVDIAHTWEPYVSEAINEGAEVIFSSKQTPGLIPDVVAMRSSFLEQEPMAAQAFIKAWLDAVDWWQKHPRKGNEMIESRLILMPDSISLKGIRLLDRQENIRAFSDRSSKQSLYQVSNHYLNFYRSQGSLKTAIKPEQILYPALLSPEPMKQSNTAPITKK